MIDKIGVSVRQTYREADQLFLFAIIDAYYRKRRDYDPAGSAHLTKAFSALEKNVVAINLLFRLMEALMFCDGIERIMVNA